MKKELIDFFKQFSIDDVKAEVVGELNEYGTDKYSYWYGNGELIVYAENEDEGTTYVIDNYGSGDVIVEY